MDETTPLMPSRNTELHSSVEENNPGTTDGVPSDTAEATSVNGNDPLALVEENNPGTTVGIPPDTAEATSVNGNDPLAPDDDTSNGSNKSTVSASDGKPMEKKKKCAKLTLKGVIEFKQMVQMNLGQHNLAAHYFLCRQYWFFTVPQALLTMIAGIFAFVATTELLDAQQIIIINVIVGSTSAIVVFLQTMSGVCEYGTRGAMHNGLAIDLRDLRDGVFLLGAKVTANFSSTNQEVDHDDENDKEFATFQSRFQQSLSGCKSNVPLKLGEAFHSVTSSLAMSKSKANMKYIIDVYDTSDNASNRYFTNMHTLLYDILAAEILEYTFFPIFPPNAKKIAEKAMKRHRKAIRTYSSFFTDDSNDVEAGCVKVPCFD